MTPGVTGREASTRVGEGSCRVNIRKAMRPNMIAQCRSKIFRRDGWSFLNLAGAGILARDNALVKYLDKDRGRRALVDSGAEFVEVSCDS